MFWIQIKEERSTLTVVERLNKQGLPHCICCQEEADPSNIYWTERLDFSHHFYKWLQRHHIIAGTSKSPLFKMETTEESWKQREVRRGSWDEKTNKQTSHV